MTAFKPSSRPLCALAVLSGRQNPIPEARDFPLLSENIVRSSPGPGQSPKYQDECESCSLLCFVSAKVKKIINKEELGLQGYLWMEGFIQGCNCLQIEDKNAH